jgi:hypothetical protein
VRRSRDGNYFLHSNQELFSACLHSKISGCQSNSACVFDSFLPQFLWLKKKAGCFFRVGQAPPQIFPAMAHAQTNAMHLFHQKIFS